MEDPNRGQPPAAIRRVHTCLGGILVLVMGLITITLLVFVFLRLIPINPKFRVDSLSLPKFSPTKNSTLISFTCHVRLIATNSNKNTLIHHNHMQAYLLHGDDILTNTTVPPFSEATNNDTSIVVNFADVVDKRVLEGINPESVTLNLMICSGIRFGYRQLESVLRVFCGHLVVSNGELTGVPNHCRLSITGS